MEKKTPKKRRKLSKKQEEKRKLAKSLKNKQYYAKRKREKDILNGIEPKHEIIIEISAIFVNVYHSYETDDLSVKLARTGSAL